MKISTRFLFVLILICGICAFAYSDRQKLRSEIDRLKISTQAQKNENLKLQLLAVTAENRLKESLFQQRVEATNRTFTGCYFDGGPSATDDLLGGDEN